MYYVSHKDIRLWERTADQVNYHTSEGKFRIIAAVHRGKSTTYAYNLYPKRRCGSTLHELYMGIGVHAELAALMNYDCKGATLYIAGMNRNDHLICTKPCARCNNLLMNSSLKYIVYMDANHQLIKVKPSDLQLMEIPAFKVKNYEQTM